MLTILFFPSRLLCSISIESNGVVPAVSGGMNRGAADRENASHRLPEAPICKQTTEAREYEGAREPSLRYWCLNF